MREGPRDAEGGEVHINEIPTSFANLEVAGSSITQQLLCQNFCVKIGGFLSRVEINEMVLFSTSGRYRALCFTYNNPPEGVDGESLSALLKSQYLVVGREVGESGTPHLQGYVEWSNARTGASVKKKLPTVHFEARKGTPKQASTYCKKEGDFDEIGDLTQQGKRTDLCDVRDAIISGGSNFRDVAQDFPNVSAHRAAATLLTYFERPRRFKPLVIWFYGSAGVGKSHRAMEMAYALTGDLDQIKVIGQNAKWWDGYDAHKAVIFEEVTEEFCSFKRMLMLLDRYECQVEVKGGMRQLRSRYMFITSSQPPDCTWKTDEKYDQLLRRIDHIQQILSWTERRIDKGDDDALPTPRHIPQDDEEAEEEDDDTESVHSGETVRA